MSFESNKHSCDRLHRRNTWPSIRYSFFIHQPLVCSARGVSPADHLARNCADPITNSSVIIYRRLSHNTESSARFVNSIEANGYNSESAKKRKSKIWQYSTKEGSKPFSVEKNHSCPSTQML